MDFRQNGKQYLAELIGAFALTFIGAGAIASGQNALLGIALAHGLAVMTMIYALGHISGAHINPAVTLGLLVGGKIKLDDAIAYIIAQLIGATLAGFALLAFFPDPSKASFLGTPTLNPNLNIGLAIFMEALLTFFLVLTVWGAAVDGRTAGPAVGLAIGMVVTMGVLIGGPYTGAALNPARALGPAIASGHLNDWYVYWIGPIVGGIVAGLLYSNVFVRSSASESRIGAGSG